MLPSFKRFNTSKSSFSLAFLSPSTCFYVQGSHANQISTIRKLNLFKKTLKKLQLVQMPLEAFSTEYDNTEQRMRERFSIAVNLQKWNPSDELFGVKYNSTEVITDCDERILRTQSFKYINLSDDLSYAIC